MGINRSAAFVIVVACWLPVGASSPRSQDLEQPVVVRGDLMWTASQNGDDFNWDQARRFCQDLSRGGHQDWRLPSIQELAALYDRRQVGGIRTLETNGAVNRYPIHLDPSLKPSHIWYWSAETSGPDRARNFDFFLGLAGSFRKEIARASGALCGCELEGSK